MVQVVRSDGPMLNWFNYHGPSEFHTWWFLLVYQGKHQGSASLVWSGLGLVSLIDDYLTKASPLNKDVMQYLELYCFKTHDFKIKLLKAYIRLYIKLYNKLNNIKISIIDLITFFYWHLLNLFSYFYGKA